MLMAELIKSLVNSTDGFALPSAATPASASKPAPSASARRIPPPESLSIADLLDDMLMQSQHREA
jgi:hypothetical protein